MGFQDTLRHLIRMPVPTLALLLLLVAPAVNAEPFQVLTQNMNRLFDNVDDGNNEKLLPRGRFLQRVKAAAKKFGTHYGLPHIIALQEVENLNVLKHVANEIKQRYHADYRLVLVPGPDVSGINLAYLVRYGVEIRKVEQLFADEVFRLNGNPLFSRPPLYLEACYLEDCLVLLNLHLRSMRGIDSHDDGERVARKRLQQAETIAGWSQRFQTTRAQESLLILGDLNALTPTDEYVDVAGIIRGKPDNGSVLWPGRDLVEPDLIDLSQLIARDDRYSYVYRRRKQQLDYMLTNQAFAADLEMIAFSEIDRRFSDHAGLLARFRW